jgi:hypothetical protein
MFFQAGCFMGPSHFGERVSGALSLSMHMSRLNQPDCVPDFVDIRAQINVRVRPKFDA